MGGGTTKAILALCACVIAASASQAQFGKGKKSDAPSSEDISRILSWLPGDTETVIGATGPFAFPDMSPRENQPPQPLESVDDLKEDFESLPLALIGFKGELLANHFLGQKVTLAIEGSRHFRNPGGIGGAPFEGCSIAVFQRDVSDRAAAFLSDSAKVALPSEQIEDQKIAVFQEQLESDVWTIYVDFPKPEIAIACTNRDYLKEVIRRMQGGRGDQALPDRLPEWKYADMHARFWGLRHFDKSQSKDDPTSPFRSDEGASAPDDQAVGVTFRFDPNKSRTATITYLSGDKAILKKLKDTKLAKADETAAKDLDIEFRALEPGVAAISYELGTPDAVNSFFMILGASLGHAIFI